MEISFSPAKTESDTVPPTLWEDGEIVFYGTRRASSGGSGREFTAAVFNTEHPTRANLDRLTHEYELRECLDSAWALRPLELVREGGRVVLFLEPTCAKPLELSIGSPMEIARFLRVAAAISTALGQVHRRGLVHKNIKPLNILIDPTTDQVRLTGFGIATRILRERQSPGPPELIDGTLAYMAPEQTGRMNRSIDARSDLYALGVTLYEVLTGSLPFTAADAMEWVHCHIARQPLPPSDRVKHIPAAVSAIIMKLLAKTAEERYQTATGLERDLRRCLAQLEAEGRIDDFELGEHDTPDRLLIPEKLYGRTREIEILHSAFDGIVKGGAPELVLVSGYSGIGKSSVVNELHKELVPPRGIFAAGKFDQYKRDIPYSTLAQAFQSFVRQLLGKSDDELRHWRNGFREGLGPNGQLMVDLIPELELIIGGQPPVPELPPQDAQRRFQLVFRRFLAVIARPEHPLALFLDDLQWLDAATLDLLENLLTEGDLRHLLLVGAYRDNEVTSAHPLMRTLDAIRGAGVRVHKIVLAPLTRQDLSRLVADSLYCDGKRVAALAELVHKKTAGNPFFVIQFLSALVEEGLLTFDHGAARWVWDLARIHAKGYTDNVVDLLLSKLSRLPPKTQNALQQLACLGNGAEFALLALGREESKEILDRDLQEALRSGLVVSSEGFYRFVHDRIQEAAYSMIPEAQRAEAHLRIGRLMAAHTPAEKQEEAIFEIVNQLNRGAILIGSRDEKEQLAELNLRAGKRAKASTAYASALHYLIAGSALLSGDGRARRPDLVFALELERAECEFLTGALAEAQERLTALSCQASTAVERAAVACLHMDVCTTLDQVGRAVEICLNYMRHLGIEWSAHPTEEEVRREYEQIWSHLGNRAIEDVIHSPLMTDPETLGTLDVLTKTMSPASFTDMNLFCLIICRAINLSLGRGNCDASCIAYTSLGRFAGPRFGDYLAGFRFSELGYELVDRRGLKRYQARTYLAHSVYAVRWMRHVRSCSDLVRRAFESANKNGDLTFATYCCTHLISDLLFAGIPLTEAQREAEHALAFTRKAHFGLIIDTLTPKLALILALRGLTEKFGCFSGREIDELSFEHQLASNPALALAECWYWIRKTQARFVAGDYASALDASSKAQRLLWTSDGYIESAEYHFYSALSRAALIDSAPADEREQHLQALAAHQRQLKLWADNGADNFGNRAMLVAAEIARIEGRELDAERLYESAIKNARENDFVHNEALANELAARFHAARGFETISLAYLRNARYCYVRWGADGKVNQLDRLCPQLRSEEAGAPPTGTIATTLEQLDLGTVIKVSQTVSAEMVLEKLLDALMRTAIEHAGAVRALLVLSRKAKQYVVAEAATHGDVVSVKLCDEPVVGSELPAAILRYVLHTQESVILDDATIVNPFSTDTYMRQHQARSVLCLPLLNQAKLIGVLYLENNLAPRVFAPARISVLKMLAFQAAISLENSRLYTELQEREARVRRLVDANIIGIIIASVDGRIIDANDAFLRMIGYERQDLSDRVLSWKELTPSEWQKSDDQRLAEIAVTGVVEPYEKEFFRKDGTRVPVLLGGALFDGEQNQGVAFVIDLTDRKRAELAARQSERRYHEMQMKLAHANRIATFGQLSASIAHEVKQPLSGILTNAGTCQLMLETDPPDVGAAHDTAQRIIRDAKRAAEVVSRLHALFAKKDTATELFSLDEAMEEVITSSKPELDRLGVLLQTSFGGSLSLVRGDRVQLQQVMLNLMRNAVESMAANRNHPKRLVVSTAHAEQNIVVAVRDSGPGVDSANLERIFDAFYSTKPDGLGMGLSICRTIIEAHRGKLWVTPAEPRGSVFQFTVPAGVIQ